MYADGEMNVVGHERHLHQAEAIDLLQRSPGFRRGFRVFPGEHAASAEGAKDEVEPQYGEGVSGANVFVFGVLECLDVERPHYAVRVAVMLPLHFEIPLDGGPL